MDDNNCTAYAVLANHEREFEMATFDALPKAVRETYSQAAHDWSTVETYFEFDAFETTEHEAILVVKNADEKQLAYHTWGMHNRFLGNWEADAVRAFKEARSKGLRTWR